jgi:Tfp pilus assembly protein PilF
MDEETLQRLEALGYMHTGQTAPPIEEVLRSDGAPPQDRVGDINLLSVAKQRLYDKQPNQAKASINTLLDRQPDNPMVLEMLATAELQLGRIDEALEVLHRIQRLQPEGTRMTSGLALQIGALHLYRGDHDTAYELLSDSQSLNPTAQVEYMISIIHGERGRVDQEIDALNAALELDPAYTPARLSLAIRLASLGENEAADSHFKTAVSNQPFMPRTHYNYGTFLVKQGETEEAERRFQRAAEVAPEYLPAHYALVALNVGLGRYDQARDYYEVLANLAPDSRETERAHQLLEGVS